MRLPNVDWALVAVLPLLLIIVGIAGGIVWLAAKQGSYGWGLLAIVLGGILVQLHRDKLSLTDNSGEPIGMPIVPSRAAEKRARPGLPNWLHISTRNSRGSRIEFRDDPRVWRAVNIGLIAATLACFAAAFLA